MTAANSLTNSSTYLEFYKYLLVLSEDQITKLRKVATGILNISAFSPEEIDLLEQRISFIGH